MTIAGESRNPERKHLLELANEFGENNPNDIIDSVQDIISKWKGYAKNPRVSKESTRLLKV